MKEKEEILKVNEDTVTGNIDVDDGPFISFKSEKDFIEYVKIYATNNKTIFDIDYGEEKVYYTDKEQKDNEDRTDQRITVFQSGNVKDDKGLYDGDNYLTSKEYEQWLKKIEKILKRKIEKYD